MGSPSVIRPALREKTEKYYFKETWLQTQSQTISEGTPSNRHLKTDLTSPAGRPSWRISKLRTSEGLLKYQLVNVYLHGDLNILEITNLKN